MEKQFSSLKIWQDLYHAADEFKKNQPWKWLYDSDIFGVQNPLSGEIGYCSVMGALGEVFSLTIYLGSDGLAVYAQALSGKLASQDMFFHMRGLMASFEDRTELTKSDFQVIKDLGLKFRGRSSWPLFRSYLPGYQPWYLEEAEAVFLTLALEQARLMALRLNASKDLLTRKGKGCYWVRVPESVGGRLLWRDEWLKPAPVPPQPSFSPQPPEPQLQKIKNTLKTYRGTWEIDLAFLSCAVKEKGRPYFPIMLLCVDHDSGLVLLADLAPFAEFPHTFQGKLLALFERTGFLPELIMFQRHDLLELFEPIISSLNLKTKKVKKLKLLDSIRDNLLGFLGA